MSPMKMAFSLKLYEVYLDVSDEPWFFLVKHRTYLSLLSSVSLVRMPFSLLSFMFTIDAHV